MIKNKAYKLSASNKRAYTSYFLYFLLGLILIYTVFFVYADTTPCTCIQACVNTSVITSCYTGECNEDNLTFLQTIDCNLSCSDSMCPACDISFSDCLNDTSFIDSVECEDYYNFLLDNSPEACKQDISGYFKNNLGNPVAGVNVNVISDIDGINYYDYFKQRLYFTESVFSFSVPVCHNVRSNITLVAEKDKYDSDVKYAEIQNNANITTEVNFTLRQGLCNADCTDVYMRCNPECEGYVDSSGDKCEFFHDDNFSASLIKSKCAFKQKGTDVILNTTNTTYTIIDCCEGEKGIRIVPRPLLSIDTPSDINIISVEKPVKLHGELIKLKLFMWDKE